MRAVCYLTLLFMTGCASLFYAPTPYRDRDAAVPAVTSACVTHEVAH